MIDALDEALRQLLVRDLPIKNNEIDVTFDQPRREWSARLSRPTLNLFLYDLRENVSLRQTAPPWQIQRTGDGTVTRRRKPVRMDFKYMITAWTSEAADEHRLLGSTLLTLFRNPFLPEDLLSERLQDQPEPVPIMVAQPDTFQQPADIWNAIDNEIRPAVGCDVTLAVDPYQPITTPLVRTRELRLGPSAEPTMQQLDDEADFWVVGGTIHSDEQLEDVQLTFVDRGVDITVQPNGDYIIGNLRPGDYELELVAAGKKPQRHRISVPSESYDLHL